MRKVLLYLTLLTSFLGHTQTMRTDGSFAYTRLTAYSRQFADAFSFSGNGAALAGNRKFAVGVFSENRFGLDGLSGYTAAIVLPTSSGNFGFRGDYLGGATYSESSAGLAYARSLGQNVSLGLQFNYYNLAVAGYGAASAINFDAGLMVHLTPQFSAGLQTCNPLGVAFGPEGREKLPSIYRMGFGYDASQQVYIGVEAEKLENKPVGINAGLQYTIAEKIVTRAGILSATSAFYLGFGVQLRSFRFDVVASLHPYLGLTPGLLMLYANP